MKVDPVPFVILGLVSAIFLFMWAVSVGDGYASDRCVKACECPHKEVAP
jgi:hypothetical protein